MSSVRREDRAIDGWCVVLSRIEGAPVTVVERPDKDKPGQGGCDAIVERRGVRHAVEHTTLDSYQRRREDDDRFRKVVLPVAIAVEETFTDSWVEMEVPVHAIPPGEDWTELRNRLRACCVEAIGGMPIAEYHDLTRTRFDWPDIPFPVWISRQPTAGDSPKCVIFRQAPGDLHAQLAADVKRALDDKTNQLRAYHDGGMPTVLLLDIDDVALTNRDFVADAFARAVTTWDDRNAVDEVYLTDSGRRPVWVYPLKLEDRFYPELPEFRTFFSDQYRANYEGKS